MSIVAMSAPLGGTLFATFLEAVPDAIVAVDLLEPVRATLDA